MLMRIYHQLRELWWVPEQPFVVSDTRNDTVCVWRGCVVCEGVRMCILTLIPCSRGLINSAVNTMSPSLAETKRNNIFKATNKQRQSFKIVWGVCDVCGLPVATSTSMTWQQRVCKVEEEGKSLTTPSNCLLSWSLREAVSNETVSIHSIMYSFQLCHARMGRCALRGNC